MAEIIAYIDEAGDEGFGKLRQVNGVGGQSRWLAIGACIVSAENDKNLVTWRNGITSRLRNVRDLHFRNLNHDQKVVVSQELAALPIGVALALSHKITIPGTRYATTFKQKGYLYNYLVRWLLERLCDECQKGDGPHRLRVVFSRRGGTDYHSMANYLRLLRNGRELMPRARATNWDVLDIEGIVVEDHSRWAGLQLADCVTSAFHCALEPNFYGNFEPRYAELLKSRLIHNDGNALNYGIIPVPSLAHTQANAHQHAFLRSHREGCGQAPGP